MGYCSKFRMQSISLVPYNSVVAVNIRQYFIIVFCPYMVGTYALVAQITSFDTVSTAKEAQWGYRLPRKVSHGYKK